MKHGLKKAGSVGADIVENFEALRLEKAQKGNYLFEAWGYIVVEDNLGMYVFSFVFFLSLSI